MEVVVAINRQVSPFTPFNPILFKICSVYLDIGFH
jgi:hypothetical protein